MLASMGQSCARECVWTACTIMGQCAGPDSGHISFTRIDVVFVPSSTKDILILKSLPIGLGGEGSLHEHSSVGMSEAQWKDYTYLSRELVVHPVHGHRSPSEMGCRRCCWGEDGHLCNYLNQQEKVWSCPATVAGYTWKSGRWFRTGEWARAREMSQGTTTD